jgi:hypothetical protein
MLAKMDRGSTPDPASLAENASEPLDTRSLRTRGACWSSTQRRNEKRPAPRGVVLSKTTS